LFVGHRYNLNTERNNGSKYWVCVNKYRKDNECRDRVTLGEGDVISSANRHKCIADMAKVEVLKCRVNCNKRAREELTCAPKIFEEEFAEATNMGLDFVCTMPTLIGFKSSMYRARRKALGVPLNVNSVNDIVFPEHIARFTNRDSFILSDIYFSPNNRTVVFGSKMGLECLVTF